MTQYYSRRPSGVDSDFIDRILAAIDLNWAVLKAPVAYKTGAAAPIIEVEGQSVLFRSDTKQELAIVSSNHQVWQPREIVDFYLSVSAFYGLAVESVGAVQGGRKLWALLDTGNRSTFSNSRSAATYLLLTTTYDSMLAARAESLCILEPGGFAFPAAEKPNIVHIARSPEFLTPEDLAAVGELMRECISFPGLLEEFSKHTPSDAQVRQATAAAFGTRRDDPSVPSARALKSVLTRLQSSRGRYEVSFLDLLYALAYVSDARDQKAHPQEPIRLSWFGAGAKRKRFALRALARMLTPD